MRDVNRAFARNAVGVVEAGYALGGSDSEWIAGILDATRSDLALGLGRYGFTCRVARSKLEMSGGYAESELDPNFSAIIGQINREVPAAFFRLVARSAIHCGSFLDITSGLDSLQEHFRAFGSAFGLSDTFSLFVQDGEGYALSVSVPSERRLETSPHVLGIWRRVGIHLASGLRLRRNLRQLGVRGRDAIFAPSGAVADANGVLRDDRTARESLANAVRKMERARTSRERRNPAHAMELWRGLAAGTWSLVDHWESDGRRYIAAYRNRPAVRDPRAQTEHERLVLHYASRGMTNKEIAFTLGVSVGSVGAAVSQLLQKLGCTRRSDLVAFADLAHARRLRVASGRDAIDVISIGHAIHESVAARLSAAERAIAERIVSGKSSAEIARERRTSVNTVANQVRHLFEKLQVRSRAELVRALVQSKSSRSG